MITAGGLLLCEMLYEDQQHNVTLLGVFTDLASTIFPTNPKTIVGYALLSGTPGEVGEMVWEVFIEESGLVYFRETARIQIGPNGKRHIHLEFLDARFRNPGTYRFTLSVEEKVIAERELFARRRDP